MSELLSELAPDSTASTKKPGKTVKLKTFLQSKQNADSPSNRKSLQQLQPSAQDEGKLVGKDGFVRFANQKSKTPKRKRDGESELPAKRQAKYISKPSKKFPIYTDNSTENKSNDGDTAKKEKSAEEIAYELMVQEEIPERYWKEIAEERRVALQNTLKENEQLHIEIKDLKEENARLKVTADQAVYLAEVVQDLLGETKDDKEEDNVEELQNEVSDGSSESGMAQTTLMCGENRLQSTTERDDSVEQDERMKKSEGCYSDENMTSERKQDSHESTTCRRIQEGCLDSDCESSDDR